MFIQAKNRFLAVDSLICQKIAVLTGRKFFDHLMKLSSKSGDGPVYLLLPVMLFIFARETWVPFTIAALTAFTFEVAVQKIVKHAIKRQRPFATVPGVKFLLSPPDQFSFPSGHTAGAFIVAALLVYFTQVPAVAVYSWALLVGFSRVYNGVHYPSDIITGAALGLISVQGTLLFLV